MAPQKFPAIALSVRPKGGISPEETSEIVKFCRRICESFSAVIETIGEDTSTRHLHGILFLKKPTAIGDLFGKEKMFHRKMIKFCERSESIWSIYCKAVGAYNDDWCEEYLKKDPSREVVADTHLQKEERMEYYVDRIPRTNTKYMGDEFFLTRERMWFEAHPDRKPVDIEEVARFLTCLMYCDRRIGVVQDPRRFKQQVRCLFQFIWKATEPDWHSYVTLRDEPRD